MRAGWGARYLLVPLEEGGTSKTSALLSRLGANAGRRRMALLQPGRRHAPRARATMLGLLRSAMPANRKASERRIGVISDTHGLIRALGQIAKKLLLHGSPTPRAAGRTCRLCDYEACKECPFHRFAASPMA